MSPAILPSDVRPRTTAAKLRRAIREPGKAVRVLLALARGQWYRTTLPWRGVRFTAGRNLRVEGSLSVRGPGRVVFGDDVVVGMRVTPWTYAPEAEIRVGSGTFLNGTRFGCQQAITIGRDCILADAQIMDTDFHSTHVNRHDPAAPVRVQPVIIEDNVWIASSVGILPGTHIGRNSVVGFGAVCHGRLPGDALIAGNPARMLRPVPGAAQPAPAGADHPAPAGANRDG